MERARRKDIMDKLVQNQTLTSDGKDFLVLSLDPFHDFDHPLSGYPDADCSSTVVRCYQYAQDISKPAAVGAGSWSAHIFSLPFVGQSGFFGTYDASMTAVPNVEIPVGSTPVQRGLLNWEINPSATTMFPTSHADAIAATRVAGCISLAASAFAGTCCRVIGAAFEIIDTTADMYRQGALTVYRMNQPRTNINVAVEDKGAGLYYQGDNLTMIHNPPSSVAQAMLLPNSRQWAMRDGVYSVLTQSTVDNPLQTVTSHGVVMASGTQATGAYLEVTTPSILSVVPASPHVPVQYAKSISIPFNTSGVMLTGLNDNTTFRIKLKVYIEQAPSFYEPDTSVLATPSAPYDPTALEAYSKILATMPVGVPAGENDAGDWFAGIAKVLSRIALPVSAALSPIFPIAPLIGAGVTAASEAAHRALTSGQKRNDMLVPKGKGQKNLEKKKKK